jgi:hypothetical protein
MLTLILRERVHMVVERPHTNFTILHICSTTYIWTLAHNVYWLHSLFNYYMHLDLVIGLFVVAHCVAM